MPIEPIDLEQETNTDKPLTSYEIMVKMAKAIEELASAVSNINERLSSIEAAVVSLRLDRNPITTWTTTGTWSGESDRVYLNSPVSSGTLYSGTYLTPGNYSTNLYTTLVDAVERLAPEEYLDEDNDDDYAIEEVDYPDDLYRF